jgi:hypothetical protein
MDGEAFPTVECAVRTGAVAVSASFAPSGTFAGQLNDIAVLNDLSILNETDRDLENVVLTLSSESRLHLPLAVG